MNCASLWQFYVSHPGAGQAEAARFFGVHRSSVLRMLPTLEEKGFLLMEDSHGKLYPFGRWRRTGKLRVRKMSAASVLCKAFAFPPLDTEPVAIVGGGFCRVTGVAITRGYPLWKVVPDTAGEFVDLLGGVYEGYVSEDAARTWKGMWNVGHVMVLNGVGYKPLVNRESAEEQGRPVLADLIRQAHEGDECVVIVNTDYKKRVWTRARPSAISDNTLVYVHDTAQNISAPVRVNWGELVNTLDFVEEVINVGFSKAAVIGGLLSNLKAAQAAGSELAMRLEKRLTKLRETPEFKIAVIAAQKEKK